RVDGELMDLVPKMQVDRYKIHDIEMVIDRLLVSEKDRKRLYASVMQAMKAAKGIIKISDKANNEQFYSRYLMDAESGISYDEPQPNTFSFNSPYGACERCAGLGYIYEIDRNAVVPDPKLSIMKGGLAPLGEYRDTWNFQVLKAVAKKFDFSLTTPIEKLTDEQLNVLLNGSEEEVVVPVTYSSWNTKDYKIPFEGLFKMLEAQDERLGSNGQNLDEYRAQRVCPVCHGARLKKESLHFKIADKNIHELAVMDITTLSDWFGKVEQRLDDRQKIIATEILKEIRARLGFLLDVGLNYLTLDRTAKTLSGGEAQRIRLATQIGSQLVNVLYILDEPSIGLHQRDNERLI